MSFDWQSLVKGVAPILGGVFGGPLGAAGVSALAQALLGDNKTGDPTKDEAAIADILSGGLTPEVRVKIIEAENQLKLATAQYADAQLQRELDETKALLADTQDARKANAGNADVFTLGIVIMVVFASLMAGMLYGLYSLLTGGMTIKDAGIAATVFSILGTILGYVANNAQQVVSFYFGSSKGSAMKTDKLADAVKQMGEIAKR